MRNQVHNKQVFSYKMSFCMIVKDEEKNLHRCLKSIQPLTNRKDVELIIIDTGSSDNSIEIAKQFTKKVYSYPWTNNFSEMRNISISYSTGEWIFILDADEELVDIEKMLKLLDSNLLENFNTVQVLYRNFVSRSSNRIIVQPSYRIFRNDGLFHYTGVVHNQPVFKEPVLSVDIYFNHYGYDNDDLELMEKKFKRTSKLLISEIKKDPTNIYYYYQLARSYAMYGDFENAIENIRKAYSLIEERKEDPNKYQHIFVNYAHIGRAAKKHQEVIKIAKKGLTYFPKQIDLYYLLGISSVILSKNHQAIEAFEKYLLLFDIGEDLPVFKDFSMEINYFDENSRLSALVNLSTLQFEEENYELALKFAEQLKDEMKNPKVLTLSLIKTHQYKKLANYYQSLELEKREMVAQLIENDRRYLGELEKKQLAKHFANQIDAYGVFNLIRITDRKDQFYTLVKSFLKEFQISTLPIFYSEIFIMMLRNGISVITEWKKINSNYLKQILKFMCESAEESKIHLNNYLKTIEIRDNDFHSSRVYIAIANIVLLLERERARKNNEEITDTYIELFSKYIDIGINYLKLLYQIDRLRLIYKTLDDGEHKLFAVIYLMNDAMEKGNIRLALSLYKEAAIIYPYMADFLSLNLYNLYYKIAQIFEGKEDYESAIEMYEESLLNIENPKEQLKIIESIEKVQIKQSQLEGGNYER